MMNILIRFNPDMINFITALNGKINPYISSHLMLQTFASLKK